MIWFIAFMYICAGMMGVIMAFGLYLAFDGDRMRATWEAEPETAVDLPAPSEQPTALAHAG